MACRFTTAEQAASRRLASGAAPLGGHSERTSRLVVAKNCVPHIVCPALGKPIWKPNSASTPSRLRPPTSGGRAHLLAGWEDRASPPQMPPDRNKHFSQAKPTLPIVSARVQAGPLMRTLAHGPMALPRTRRLRCSHIEPGAVTGRGLAQILGPYSRPMPQPVRHRLGSAHRRRKDSGRRDAHPPVGQAASPMRIVCPAHAIA